ncbi:peptidase M24, structural domain-containing protein [Syncephalis pseudoplumigaleata]|uniref:Methionine aminopeptidase n=1 Tax=Syncephalis pseudoplumigaleata TaxID=1712513 RepID=A0A4P9Z689_9FUNG|nr:peptidase M24, structural domain-containing protein [Syncephalis pseudoplumigaleata]|eukprot:RKP28157.1 peptidase M24, structural domain-containing protein [Syncephalis pseudoplumigaleata]
MVTSIDKKQQQQYSDDDGCMRPPSLRVGVGHIEQRPVPASVTSRPPYAGAGSSYTYEDEHDGSIELIARPEQTSGMRAAGQLAAQALQRAAGMIEPGVTTEQLDEALHAFICQHGAYPSPLNYRGFPRSICTSVSNVIAHGIPDKRPLEDGDIINVDVTVYRQGYHGDTSATFLVGQVDAQGQALVHATREAMEAAIRLCGPGVPLREIGRAICDVAEARGFRVSDELSGHGIGRLFHTLPLIYHHRNDEPGAMQAGMAFTIEPVLCQGSARSRMWPDGWTLVTADGGRSAQFEHTILVTADGHEVLTLPTNTSHAPLG